MDVTEMRLNPGTFRENALASLFTWLLLGGFIVSPNTFASLHVPGSEAVWKAVQFVPLIWIAGFSCSIGACGMFCLWWGNSENYVWLIDHIFWLVDT